MNKECQQGRPSFPRFQSHRGYWRGGIKENTLSSFRESKRQGFEMIEFDVRLSREGTPVIIHDEHIQAEGSSRQLIRQMDVKQLASWGIPTLEEVLRDPSIPAWKNIEIKCAQRNCEGIESAVHAVIEKTGAQNIIISSFNPLVLSRFRKINPHLTRALLVEGTPSKTNKIYLRKMWLTFLAKPHLLHLEDKMVDSQVIEKMKKRDVEVVAWTVNDLHRMKELIGKGVIGIITDLSYHEIREMKFESSIL